MKQLLFLLLFLLPCLALAQYQGNGNQKITLGEQTTADGLVWRGRTSDTSNLMTNKIDTSAYLVLDTITEAIWLYRASTTPKWNRVVDSLNNLQGQLSLTTKVTGMLPVANGGTNTSTLTANKVMVGNGTSGVLTPTNLHWDNTNERLGIGTASPSYNVDLNKNSGNLGIIVKRGNNNVANFGSGTSGTGLFGIFELFNSSGTDSDIRLFAGLNESYLTNTFLGIGTKTPAVQLHTTGAVRFATFAGGGTTTLDVDNTGNLARTSSIELKKDVTPINYGLNQILQINPINFNWIDEDKYGNENENGFIAEDVMNVIPNVVGSDAHGLFMDYTKLIPILTKAIQEQNLLIKALEQRIINLENK